jgi:formylglycine-generating enzyme
LMFSSPLGPVDLCDWSQCWRLQFGANWKKLWARFLDQVARRPSVVHVAYRDAEVYAGWARKALPTEVE